MQPKLVIAFYTLNEAQRDVARQALTDLLKHLANYLELVAHNNTALLATTGYDLRKDIVRGIHGGTLLAPSDFKIAHGP